MDLSHRMVSGFTIQSQTDSGPSGKPVWGVQRSLTALVEQQRVRVTTPTGTTVQVVDVLLSHDTLLNGDRVWEPDDSSADDKQAKRLAAVSKSRSYSDGRLLYRAELR